MRKNKQICTTVSLLLDFIAFPAQILQQSNISSQIPKHGTVHMGRRLIGRVLSFPPHPLGDIDTIE